MLGKQIQNLADVSESECAAYENSNDAKADQDSAAFLLSDDGRADGILPSRAELNNEIQRQEERNIAMKMKIAWQTWLRDSSRSKVDDASFEGFEKWLNRFAPKEKEARLDRFVREFWQKPSRERKIIAKAAGITPPNDAKGRAENQDSAFQRGFLDKMFPASSNK